MGYQAEFDRCRPNGMCVHRGPPPPPPKKKKAPGAKPLKDHSRSSEVTTRIDTVQSRTRDFLLAILGNSGLSFTIYEMRSDSGSRMATPCTIKRCVVCVHMRSLVRARFMPSHDCRHIDLLRRTVRLAFVDGWFYKTRLFPGILTFFLSAVMLRDSC